MKDCCTHSEAMCTVPIAEAAVEVRFRCRDAVVACWQVELVSLWQVLEDGVECSKRMSRLRLLCK